MPASQEIRALTSLREWVGVLDNHGTQISLVDTEPKWTALLCGKYNQWCSSWLCRFNHVQVKHFVNSRLLKFSYFRSSAVLSKANGAYVWYGQFDALFGYFNANDACSPRFLKVENHVQNFLIILGVLGPNIRVVSSNSIQIIITDSLYFFLSIHVVFSQICFVL